MDEQEVKKISDELTDTISENVTTQAENETPVTLKNSSDKGAGFVINLNLKDLFGSSSQKNNEQEEQKNNTLIWVIAGVLVAVIITILIIKKR